MPTRQTDIQRRVNANTRTDVRRTRSVTGRMSVNGRTAGGQAQTLGDGRQGRMASRRQRYYDVRKGLGLAGG